MQRYQCHKQVWATKIKAIEFDQDGSAKIATDLPTCPSLKSKSGFRERFKGSENDLGYYVEYDDGYQSWSPTKAFEEGYSLIKSHKNTITYEQTAPERDKQAPTTYTFKD